MGEREMEPRSRPVDEGDAGSERSEEAVSQGFGPFVYDPLSETLTGPEGEIRLRPQVFQLLGLLIREAPRPVPQQRSIDEIWDLTHVSAGSIQRTVSELRTSLGDDARAPIYVETVHRRGYRFVATLEPVILEAEAETDPGTAPQSRPEVEGAPVVSSEGEDSPSQGVEIAMPTRSLGPQRYLWALWSAAVLAGALWVIGSWGGRGSEAPEPGPPSARTVGVDPAPGLAATGEAPE